MKIYIGADHGGFELKKEIIEYVNGIKENGVDIEIEVFVQVLHIVEKV